MANVTAAYTWNTNDVITAARLNANNQAYVAGFQNIDNTNIGAAGLFASNLIPTTTGQATFGGSTVGYTFAAPNSGVTPLTVCGFAGQAVDIFDVTLTNGGTKEVWVSSAGVLSAIQSLVAPGMTNGSGQLRLTGTFAGAGVIINNATTAQVIATFQSALSQQAFIDQNGAFYGGGIFAGYTTFGAIPTGASATVDLGASRSTTSGLLALGGSSTAGYIDWGVSTSATVSITKSGGGYAPVNGGTYTNASDGALKTNVVPLATLLAAPLDASAPQSLAHGLQAEGVAPTAPAAAGASPGPLNSVLQLNPASYAWVDTPGVTEFGFIAQEVEAIFPSLVRTDVNGIKGLVYTGITAALVAALQELTADFNAYVEAHP